MSEVVSVLDLYLRTLRRQHRLCVKFEPAKSILAYGFVGVGIEEVDQHELFRVPRKIVRKRIYETLLALKVGAIETFTEIQPMGSLSRVESRSVLRTLRSQGIEPCLVLRDLCFSFLEFVAAQGHGLKNDWTMRQSLNAHIARDGRNSFSSGLGVVGLFWGMRQSQTARTCLSLWTCRTQTQLDFAVGMQEDIAVLFVGYSFRSDVIFAKRYKITNITPDPVTARKYLARLVVLPDGNGRPRLLKI